MNSCNHYTAYHCIAIWCNACNYLACVGSNSWEAKKSSVPSPRIWQKDFKTPFRTSTDRFNYLPLIEIALRLHTFILFFLDDQINQSSEHAEDSMGPSESAEFQKYQLHRTSSIRRENLDWGRRDRLTQAVTSCIHGYTTAWRLILCCVRFLFRREKKGISLFQPKKRTRSFQPDFPIAKKLQKNSENTNSQVPNGNPLVCQVYEKHGYNITRET